MALMPTKRMGPPPGASPADAHDCIMVRIRMEPTAYKVRDVKMRRNGELPSDCQ